MSAPETETLDKLYLELSHVTQAISARELALIGERDRLLARIVAANEVMRSMSEIVRREMSRKDVKAGTNWEAFDKQLQHELKAQHKIMYPGQYLNGQRITHPEQYAKKP